MPCYPRSRLLRRARAGSIGPLVLVGLAVTVLVGHASECVEG